MDYIHFKYINNKKGGFTMLKRSKFSKVSIIATIMVLLLSMVLTGCASNKKDEVAATTAGTVAPAATAEATVAPDATPAALPEVKLTWYFPGNFPQAEQELVFAEVNKIVKAKINATVDFKALSFGDYEPKMKVVIASGEPYDLAFTSNWLNNYTQNVAKGAFLPLDDLLAQYAPKAFAAVPKPFWDATRVKGKIYGFINYQISARTPVVDIETALVDKYKLDLNSIAGKINPDTLNSLEPFITSVVKDSPQKGAIMDINYISGDFFDIEPIVGMNVPGAVSFHDDSLKVVNQFETDGLKKYAAVMRDWNKKGLMNAKDRVSKKTDEWVDAKAGKWAVDIGGAYKPGGNVLASSLAGVPYSEIPAGTPHLTTGGIIATMHAISRTSKNPERAMMLLELLNTDKELYNLLNFGIKDKHFTIDPDGFMVKEGDAAKAYQPDVPWMFASNFLANVQKGMPKTVWEDTIKVNEAALPSKLLGFSFDAEPVKGEIGKVSAVFDEYSRAIELGISNEAKYNEFLAKLKTAGSDKIIAEMQKQIDAWKAAK
jgi:putative aldouronate transport system substrate-binding protein